MSPFRSTLLALAIVACAAAPASTVAPYPTTIRVIPRWTVDSLSLAGSFTRIEQGACVRAWARVGDTLVIGVVELASRIEKADSVAIYSRTANLCGEVCPSIHWHVVDNGWLDRPSEVDMNTAGRTRSQFSLLGIGGTPEFVMYGMKPFAPGSYFVNPGPC